MKKYSKQFFCVSNTDGSPSTPNNFQINFSNSSVTNIQSNANLTRTYFTPQLFSCDWFFNNVSEEIRNNKFVVSQPGAPGVVITIPTNVYDGPAFVLAVNAAMAGQVFNVAGANMVFANAFSAITSKFTWAFAPASTGITTISFVNTIGGVQYDSAKVFGSITPTIQIAAGVTNFTMLGNVDLVPFQVIRIHSNCAKRTFQKSELITSGANVNPTSVLQGTDILFEVPIYSAQIGSVITWQPITSELYRQDLVSNFDQFNISLRDKKGNLIPLLPNCEVNLTFMIERELVLPNPDNVKNAIADYAQFSAL